MKIALGNRRQLALWVVLAVVLLFAILRMRGTGGGSEPIAVAHSSSAAPGEADIEAAGSARPRGSRGEKVVSPDEVPIVNPGDLASAAARPEVSGRNLFDFRPPTLPPPPTSTPAPPPPPHPGQVQFVGPLLPPTVTPTPLPPEVSFKFIGSFGPRDRPVAVLAQGQTTINAREGDIVFEHFIVRKIGYESVDVGFVGRDPKDTRRIGLTP